MKRIIALLLTLILIFLLVACSNSQNESKTDETVEEKKSVALTSSNIKQYIEFEGEFTNGRHDIAELGLTVYGFNSWADLEFRAYPIVSGKFENVEIELTAQSDDYLFDKKYGWYIEDSDNEDEVVFSFKLGANGEYSKTYKIKMFDELMSGTLSGKCDFIVNSVSGIYIPD